MPAIVLGEVAGKGGRLLVKLLVALAVAAVLAAICTAVVALITDVSASDIPLACLLGAVATLGPTAACVGVSHGIRKIASIRRSPVQV